jgi:ABC-type phosphate/phosphonate transport system substrate-binding protein
VRPILVGAVIYDPKVAVIWEIIARFFESAGCHIDCVFYTNYGLQVDALVQRQIDIAWNSPLAWVDAQMRTNGECRALAMRDTDQGRVTHLLVKAGGGLTSASQLRGKKLAVGAKDSPQATLLPIHHLWKGAGLRAGSDFQVQRHDVLVGKHGDHVGGEREALQSLIEERSDAACVLDLNWQLWSADGTCDPEEIVVLETTAPFDHCNFTALGSFPERTADEWTRVLLSMDYANPSHREMMDLEGLKVWLPGRVTGYEALTQAVDEQRFFEAVTG